MTKFFIDQHGCAKNQTDGELITGFLEQEGFSHTFNPDEADFILVNSCGFIASAKKESIDAVYNIRKSYPNAKLILCGCLAERYSRQLYTSMPELDGVFGNGDLSKISDFMKKIAAGYRLVETYAQQGICSGHRPVLYNFKGSAFVKITEGCSHHCTFCAIPLIRGDVRSRPCDDILTEIRELLAAGVYEINLIGQDLAAYEPSLPFLLNKISSLPGDFLVRLLYIHPDNFSDEIIEAVKKDSRIARYFDIPFQSGDDTIIHAMNRRGTGRGYAGLIQKIRAELPGCAIRTTFLTGFPGETEQMADNTLEFLEKIQPDWSGCFPYSREEDTPAYSFKNRVPQKTAQKRAERLESAQADITRLRLSGYVGRTLSVLVEEVIKADPELCEDADEGLAIGRASFQAPEVDGSVVIRYDCDDKAAVAAVQAGAVVQAEVIAVTGVDLDARFISLLRPSSQGGVEFIDSADSDS